MSNAFQVLNLVDEDNNHINDDIEKVKEEMEKDDPDVKPNLMEPEQERAFL